MTRAAGFRMALAGFALAALLGPMQCEAARKKPKKAKAEKGAAGRALEGCREPAPADPDLVAGLDLYLQGKWSESLERLRAWAARPEAAADPAAGRGYYALAFAERQAGRPQDMQQWTDRARPLLEARLAESPTLEGYYYVASLQQGQGRTQDQLTTVAAALRALEAGTCPSQDGDDLFRKARLYQFAGQREQQQATLEAASTAYAAGRGSIAAYRALVEKELADSARARGDVEAWGRHAEAAAALDPGVPGVHRSVGLALIERGDLQGAWDYWRANWAKERQDGNELVYALPVLQDVIRFRVSLGETGKVPDLAAYTVPALEQNAITEGRRYLELLQEKTALAESGQALEAGKQQEMDVAEYRMSQFLLEYVRRGHGLSEFALQNGLVAAIHGRGLPTR